MTSIYAERSVFEVARSHLDSSVTYDPNQAFDLAVIQFGDDGDLVDREQPDRAVTAITDARTRRGTGAVVVAFIHGWHHNAEWDGRTDAGDEHFSQFRHVLMTLALREAERGPKGRRVVGLYLTWNGDPPEATGRGTFRHMTYWDRIAVAQTVGRDAPIRQVLAAIIASTKGKLAAAPDLAASPLVFVGHSMGALIFETAYTALLRENPTAVIRPAAPGAEPVRTTSRGKSVDLPDLVLLVNSAALSEVAEELSGELNSRRIRRTVSLNGRSEGDPGLMYPAPLVISATSSADRDTRWFSLLANLGRRTEGHERDLRTHDLEWTGEHCPCAPLALDSMASGFNQAWHCLRPPSLAANGRWCFPIDLPHPEPGAGEPLHTRCRLRPVGPSTTESPHWLIQLPREVIPDHNDIFGPRSSLLMLALMQISGAVVSLADSVDQVFERDPV